MYKIVKKTRILVIEDEISVQQVLCFFLAQSGFEALGVSDGQGAMRLIPEFHPHLIILDLIMSPTSGWDVLHWLRINHITPAIPVLVLSARGHLSEQIHGFEEGAIEYITKPIQPSFIVERVHAILLLSAEQRTLLQHEHMNEQRKALERLSAAKQKAFMW